MMDFKDLIIEDLAASEARLRDAMAWLEERNVYLESLIPSYQMLAKQGIEHMVERMRERDTARQQLAAVKHELAEFRARVMADDGVQCPLSTRHPTLERAACHH